MGRLADLLAGLSSNEAHAVMPVFGDRLLKVRLGDGYWLGPLLRGNVHEPEVQCVLERVLTPDALFVDCGANVGYWSVYATKRIRDPDRIVAVEASPHIYDLLIENSALNPPGFRCVQAAVWDSARKEISIAVDERRHAWSSAEPTIAAQLFEVGFKESRVRGVPIDELTAGCATERVILKLDLEGGEPRALEGAESTLARDPVVLYEEHGRDSSSAASAALMERGFRIFSWVGDGLTEIREPAQAATVRDSAVAYNYVAARSGGGAARALGI